jgi:hypothetical protein
MIHILPYTPICNAFGLVTSVFGFPMLDFYVPSSIWAMGIIKNQLYMKVRNLLNTSHI